MRTTSEWLCRREKLENAPRVRFCYCLRHPPPALRTVFLVLAETAYTVSTRSISSMRTLRVRTASSHPCFLSYGIRGYLDPVCFMLVLSFFIMEYCRKCLHGPSCRSSQRLKPPTCVLFLVCSVFDGGLHFTLTWLTASRPGIPRKQWDRDPENTNICHWITPWQGFSLGSSCTLQKKSILEKNAYCIPVMFTGQLPSAALALVTT